MHDRQLYDPEVVDEVTLRPEAGKTVGMLVLWIAFLAGGWWLIDQGIGWGWVAAVLGALGVLLSGAMLLPGGASLYLAPEGFTLGSLFRSYHVRWDHAIDIRVVTVGVRKRMVGFDLSDACPDVQKAGFVVEALRGVEGVLPDTYGLDADELADLLREWQAHYTR